MRPFFTLNQLNSSQDQAILEPEAKGSVILILSLFKILAFYLLGIFALILGFLKCWIKIIFIFVANLRGLLNSMS